ncbi:MAG: deoxyguanosinetriphosphate triphosphohydrolase, partial [Planctomycetes bacterium]|nr:deoxyguanosinetriphosphate triphosphohydrolase [Planctomycetota bacterium]
TFVKNPVQLPPQYQMFVSQDGIQKAVCDYISGMTDRYAQNEVKKLFYPFEHIL